MRKLSIFLLFLFFVSSQIFAGGYQVRLQGQKQTGIGLIGTPFAFGASSIFYNPGSLSFMKDKYSFSGGVSPIFGTAAYRAMDSDYTTTTDSPVGTPFYFYGAGKVNEKLSVGIGVYTPFGNSVVWDNDWNGKLLVQEIALQTIFIQPTLSYKINDKFGFGAGFVFATGSVDLTRAVPSPVDGSFNMQGNTTAMGFNAGVYINPVEALKIGVSYRSGMTMSVEGGDVTFSDIPGYLQTSFPATNKFDADLPIPANLDVGLAYSLTEKLTLAVEMNYVFWSAYDSLNIDFEENTDLLADSKNPREYSNSMILRFGGEYIVNDKFSARAGVYYDPRPTNEKYFTPETVSLNTLAFTLGFSIMPTEGLSIDLSLLQLNGMEEEMQYEPENFAGTYKTTTVIPGIGISYSF